MELVGGKDEMCSYKHTHNSAVHTVGLVEGEQSYNADGTFKETKFSIKKIILKFSSGGVNNKTTVEGGVKRTTPAIKFVKP